MAESGDKTDEILDSSSLSEGKPDPIQCQNNPGRSVEASVLDEEADVLERKPRGGYTCAVPKCTNNSKRDRHLSWDSFPDGKSKEKKELR